MTFGKMMWPHPVLYFRIFYLQYTYNIQKNGNVTRYWATTDIFIGIFFSVNKSLEKKIVLKEQRRKDKIRTLTETSLIPGFSVIPPSTLTNFNVDAMHQTAVSLQLYGIFPGTVSLHPLYMYHGVEAEIADPSMRIYNTHRKIESSHHDIVSIITER